MNYKILYGQDFGKAAKRLSKKYPSFRKELSDLVASLAENPKQGTMILENCYKIRLSIASKNTGKSGGARIVTFVRVEKENIYLLYVYDKSEIANIADNTIKDLIKTVLDMEDIPDKPE